MIIDVRCEVVCQLQQNCNDSTEGLMDQRLIDGAEERAVDQFCCGCRLVNDGPCSSQFSRPYILATRANAAELSWNELNMTVMGQVMALTSTTSTTTFKGRHYHQPKERKLTHTSFYHQGLAICRKTFLFLHGIGPSRFKAIKASYLDKGLAPRVHGQTGNVPAKALVLQQVINYYASYTMILIPYSQVKDIIRFVLQYGESNAILLPGRVLGYKRDDIQLLPCSTTKKSVWKLYQETALLLSLRQVSYRSFCKVWQRFLPHLVVARPMTDLCVTCQKNSVTIMRSCNLNEEDKSEVNNFKPV